MIWHEEEWLSIDLETTGLDTATAMPVEIGLVWMLGCEVTRSRRWLVNPEIPIPEEAAAIHGINDAAVVNMPTIAEYAEDLLRAVGKARVVVGYNGYHYDFPILSRLIPEFRERCRGRAILDPLVLVRTPEVGKYWRGKGRHRLTSVVERIGAPGADEDRAHGAVYDAEMAAKVLWYFRDHLPADGAAAQRHLVAAHRKQEAEFQAWRARQPAQEAR